MNKRGLSDIVVSVLLILLVLSAIVIIWTFVRPVVLGASKDVRTDDFTTKIDIYPQEDLNGEIKFAVKRGAGKGDLAGFYVSYQDSTGKAVTDNVNYSTSALQELEAKTVYFNYTVAGLTDIVKISIVPLFHLSDNTIETGKNVVVKQIGSYTPDNTSPNPVTVTCTSFEYSAWSPSSCSSGQQQTRTITLSSPSGCTGGNPEPLTQPCSTPNPSVVYVHLNNAATVNTYYGAYTWDVQDLVLTQSGDHVWSGDTISYRYGGTSATAPVTLALYNEVDPYHSGNNLFNGIKFTLTGFPVSWGGAFTRLNSSSLDGTYNGASGWTATVTL
jgi:hypothetical protein